MRNSVVLPAPFAPMMPTMPPRGMLHESVVDQQPVAIAFADVVQLDDLFAEPRTGRDVQLGRFRCAACTSFDISSSKRARRALLLA